MLCTFWVAATDAGHRGVQGECEECQAEARTVACCWRDAVLGSSSGEFLPMLCTVACRRGDAVLGSNSGELFICSMYQLLWRCCAW